MIQCRAELRHRSKYTQASRKNNKQTPRPCFGRQNAAAAANKQKSTTNSKQASKLASQLMIEKITEAAAAAAADAPLYINLIYNGVHT